MELLTRALATTLVLVGSSVSQLPAFAGVIEDDFVAYGERGNWTGADVATGQMPASPQATDKAEITSEYAAVKRGVGDAIRLEGLVERYAKRYGGMAAVTGVRHAGSPRSFATNVPSVSSRILPLTQYGQQKNYWCGPATAYMLMRYKGILTSRYPEARWQLSQTAFAAQTYLKTEQYGSTKWDLKVMALALNRWMWTPYYVQVPYSSSNQFSGIMVHSIDNSMPPAPSTVEYSGGVHYNGHPNKLIGHWLVGYGYGGSGATSYLADPATTVWSTVRPKFTYSSNSFGSVFTASHGTVY